MCNNLLDEIPRYYNYTLKLTSSGGYVEKNETIILPAEWQDVKKIGFKVESVISHCYQNTHNTIDSGHDEITLLEILGLTSINKASNGLSNNIYCQLKQKACNFDNQLAYIEFYNSSENYLTEFKNNTDTLALYFRLYNDISKNFNVADNTIFLVNLNFYAIA